MTPAEIVRNWKPLDRDRRLWEAAMALLPSAAAPAGEAPAIDPETVTRTVDRFHGATFYYFAKMLAGHEQQFREGMAEAIKASREAMIP
jgi:hypothetical protein